MERGEITQTRLHVLVDRSVAQYLRDWLVA